MVQSACHTCSGGTLPQPFYVYTCILIMTCHEEGEEDKSALRNADVGFLDKQPPITLSHVYVPPSKDGIVSNDTIETLFYLPPYVSLILYSHDRTTRRENWKHRIVAQCVLLSKCWVLILAPILAFKVYGPLDLV